MTAALHGTETPTDISAAIRAAKTELRARIGDYTGVFAEVEDAMKRAVAEIVALRERGEEVWPVVRFADIAAGTVPGETVEAIRRRGCAIVRGTFPRERAEAWDAELVSYLEDNDFMGRYTYLDDGIFGGLAAGKPSIFPIYWSRPQMQAREDANMVAVRGFLNSFWKHESEGRVWFDPDRDTAYPDRVRRRAPGADSDGLSPHTDSGSVERWLLPAYQKVFRHVFDGNWTEYDPWDGAYRTDVHEYRSTVMCSAFRTFQGWTALSDMARTAGVLNVLPIPDAMVYLLLRALQDDIADDDLCGAANGQALPINEKYHSILLPGMSPIPDVEPGDTVWWHADVVHAVDPVSDQKGWGNVMYIPAAPHCAKNAAYATECGKAFLTGESPSDFAPEHYEIGWSGRPGRDDLSPTGLRQLGLQDR
ncbi:YbiU family protein [Pseudonocardia nigra]|uniref:YbiU family protein n=1 Tax=Pseudonocardia nigra TaxID=1921578 RepID=UPI001C5DE301|nr:YbiU family protein [Pseudonocardia nigra]